MLVEEVAYVHKAGTIEGIAGANKLEECGCSCVEDTPCIEESACWEASSCNQSPVAVWKEAWTAAHGASQGDGGSC
jgi:hypothetical protein